MAKKQEQTSEPFTESSSQYAPFFHAELLENQKRVGRHNVMVDRDASARKYGLEIPSLALQYVLHANVLFMESVILLDGPPNSHKSSLALEIARWVIGAGGYGRVFDTEAKADSGLDDLIIGSGINERTWHVIACPTMDDWIVALPRAIALYKDYFILNRPLKPREKRLPLLPVCTIIDSVTGRSTEDNQESAAKDGPTNVQGMQMAKQIAYVLQNFNLLYAPWYIFAIRHVKRGAMQGYGPAAAYVERASGGASLDYFGRIHWRLKVVDEQQRADGGHHLVRIRCLKNSSGEGKLECGIRFVWRYASTGDGRYEAVWWDWPTATAEFLAGFDSAAVRDVCHVTRSDSGTKAEPRFSCKQLKLKDVSASDLDISLRADAAMYAALQDALFIKRYPIFDPQSAIPELS